MKYKNFRYIMPVMLLLWMMFTTSSCVRDEFADESGSADCSSVTIKVKMPELSVTAPGSRAVVSDFDTMDDINIFIAIGDAISDRIYLPFASVNASGYEIVPGVTITYEDVNEYREFHLNFTDKYWENHPAIPLKTCLIYAVANWGRAIEPNDANTVTQLRNLKTSSTSTDINGNPHSTVVMPNRMFGEIERDYTTPTDKPGEVTRNVEIELNRTAAMVTLVIDGSGLYKGVVIDVKDVSLRNVPVYCTIGRENKITAEASPLVPIEGSVSEYGDRKGGALISGGYRLVGTDTQSWTDFGNEMGYRTTIGKHYTDGDYNDVTVQPLFLYENMHGGDAFGADETDQRYKRPAGVDRDKASIEANTKACSYIEINADYMRYEEYNGSPEIREKGTATWRFFLGRNEFRNFDVERNTHYKLSLTLSGTGITENNQTWRVDAETKTSQVVGDANMVVGGGGEMFCVEFTGNISEIMKKMKMSGPTATFVYVRAKPSNTYEWAQVSNTGGANDFETVDDKQMWFYVQPLLPNDNSTTANERSCEVTFSGVGNGGDKTEVVVKFTQYRPVTFSITQADLNNYPTDENLLKAKAMIEKYYNHDFGTGKDFVFYVDRVDRDPMQWGFNGVLLDSNQDTGFENVYHLIDPKPVGDNCMDHVEYAKNYLPTGKGWNDGEHIDYSRGSCMMHAAMENHFQQYYPYPGNNVSVSSLVNMTTLPSRPTPGTGAANDYSYSWCVPSIVGYQVMEKLDAFYKAHNINDRGFDPKYPITKWVSYWTSNFGALDLKDKYPELNIDGRTRSFAYQFDMGLDKITENDLYPGYLLLPRTSMLRYRLINIRPEN